MRVLVVYSIISLDRCSDVESVLTIQQCHTCNAVQINMMDRYHDSTIQYALNIQQTLTKHHIMYSLSIDEIRISMLIRLIFTAFDSKCPQCSEQDDNR